jgi:hypothetical protein
MAAGGVLLALAMSTNEASTYHNLRRPNAVIPCHGHHFGHSYDPLETWKSCTSISQFFFLPSLSLTVRFFSHRVG